ncbi:MAG: hypothetical protein JOZ13_00185 [Alphaproteobacteria bacterium]|nr:hypothetical protein [Alphaproteobacteria bacterium]
MEPISPADRLVMLLRQKLEERARTQRGSGKQAHEKPDATQPLEPSGIHALAALDGADDRSLRRAIVQNLLADQLGQGLINDAQFQQVVSRVTDAIEDDPTASGLMQRVLAEIRSS